MVSDPNIKTWFNSERANLNESFLNKTLPSKKFMKKKQPIQNLLDEAISLSSITINS
jgi:hypothetical protein